MSALAKPWMTFANRRIVHECEIECRECEGTGEVPCPECGGIGHRRSTEEEDRAKYEHLPSAAAFIKNMDELREWQAFERAHA